jgi:hypothetical protein
MNGTAIAPVPVVAGISDGTYTELVGSPIAEGTVVVVRASTPANAPNTPTTGSGNPLLPQRPGVGRRG